MIRDPGGAEDGLFARDEHGKPLCWNRDAVTPPLSRSEGGGREGVDSVQAAQGVSSTESASTPPRPSPSLLEREGVHATGAVAPADAIDISPAIVRLALIHI